MKKHGVFALFILAELLLAPFRVYAQPPHMAYSTPGAHTCTNKQPCAPSTDLNGRQRIWADTPIPVSGSVTTNPSGTPQPVTFATTPQPVRLDTSVITPTVEIAIAFGSVSASYTSILTNAALLKRCIFNNATNQPVSWDDGTTSIISGQPAGSVIIDDYGANGRDVRTNIRLKYTSSAPASGTVYLNCYS